MVTPGQGGDRVNDRVSDKQDLRSDNNRTEHKLRESVDLTSVTSTTGDVTKVGLPANDKVFKSEDPKSATDKATNAISKLTGIDFSDREKAVQQLADKTNNIDVAKTLSGTMELMKKALAPAGVVAAATDVANVVNKMNDLNSKWSDAEKAAASKSKKST